MHAGKIAFAQLTDLIHPEQFHRCVRRYHGDYKVKSFSCWDQFLCMAFGQLTYRESLRDVETCLRSRQDQLYHLGIRGEVSHSTWPMPTESGTGASTMTWLNFSSGADVLSITMNRPGFGLEGNGLCAGF